MTAFVLIAAVALIIQAGMLYGIYRSSRAIQENVARLLPKVEALVDTSRATIEESRTHMNEISSRTTEILDTARKQMARVDSVLEDAAQRARIQMDRAEMVLDDAMVRTQEAVAMVHKSILKPLREINAVAAGLRAAFYFLMRGRPNPERATADEEMFI